MNTWFLLPKPSNSGKMIIVMFFFFLRGSSCLTLMESTVSMFWQDHIYIYL